MRKINENAKELSPEKLETLTKNAYGILAECRRSLLDEFPFYGSVVMNMEIQPTRDVRLPTAACDGRTIFFDIDFLSTLQPEHQKFVFAHECMHAIMATQLREDGRDHEIFNIASDIEINELLKKDGLSVPPSACMCSKFNLPENLSAEEYYEMLTQNPPPMPQGGGSGKSKSDTSFGSSGNSDGKLEGQFDKHFDKNTNIEAEKNPEDSNMSDKYGKLGYDKNFNPNVCEANAEKMREAAISAAQTYEKQRGELPAHLQSLINSLTKSEINWKEILQNFVTRSIGSESNWNIPNRRFVASRTYLPSRTSESVKLGVIIDTSGSTSGDIPKFLGELNGLVNTFPSYTLNILQVDTVVNSCDTYSDENPLDLENTKFEVNGGGGTIIKPGFDYILDNDIECDAIVVFTDGYTEKFSADMDPGIPTLWMVTKDGSTDNFDFGEVCEFKEDTAA